MKEQWVTFELVLDQLRQHNFAVLATVGDGGEPHSAGVSYGVSRPDRDLAIYLMTRLHLLKARNIARNPRSSLVVPLPRRVLRFVPPATIQLRGRAEILDWTDEAGTDVFRRFWMGRRILAAYEKSHRGGETRICFLKITPDPIIHTYAVGYSVWELSRRMEAAAARVVIPPEHRSSVPSSGSPRHPDDRKLTTVAAGSSRVLHVPRGRRLRALRSLIAAMRDRSACGVTKFGEQHL